MKHLKVEPFFIKVNKNKHKQIISYSIGGLNSKLILNKTYIINNKAYKDGGALKWISNEPIYYDILFKDNTAIYGNDKASLPFRMKLNIYDITRKDYIKINQTRIPELENLISGKILNYKIEIEVVDINDLVISSLNFFEYIIILFLIPLIQKIVFQ